MKGTFKPKILLLLVAVVMQVSAVLIPLSGSLSHSYAASSKRSAARSHSKSVPSSVTIPSNVAEAARAYWTPARMKAAIPVNITFHGKPTPPKQPTSIGKPGSAPPVAPKHRSIQTPTGKGTAPIKPSATYPFPYNRFAVPTSDYTQFPYSTIGKVFFTDSLTGSNFVCSGTAVTSTNSSVVDTVGHCVIQRASGNNWYTNWIFCPGYLDGHCQLGEWTARQLWSSTGWFNNGDFEYDYGEAVMNTNNGSTLVDAVGAEGWAYNHPRDQFFHALGYPAEAPFNGERMIECDAPYATDDSPNGVSPAAMGIGCDMTGGSSGGGWLIQFGSARGMVNGHNDYKYDSQPLAMYSPYYGDDWFAVFNSAQQS